MFLYSVLTGIVQWLPLILSSPQIWGGRFVLCAGIPAWHNDNINEETGNLGDGGSLLTYESRTQNLQKDTAK